MLKNYLKIAIRSLLKNSVYSFINIFGLAVGLSCSLLISLWVIDEYSFDNFHQKKDRLYQVMINFRGDNGIITGRATMLPLGEELKSINHDIQRTAVTDWSNDQLLVVGDKQFMKSGNYVSEDFLKMFSFKLLKGSPETALKDPNGIVLTASTARALYGTDDVLGKTLLVDNTLNAVVTGVVEDVPSNSSFQFECLLPFESYIRSQPWVKNAVDNWDNNSFQLYVELAEGASQSAVEASIKDVIKNHSDNKETTAHVIFHPMNDWRLRSKFENGKITGGAIEQVQMFSIIAIFILVIACINFMNLATARSERRAREVGIRKTVGSKRKELVFQFLGESILVSTISFILAIFITELVLPFFNNLVGKSLFIDFNQPLFWIACISIILVTGLISGSYPAFYLSSFNAVSVLKGKLQIGKAATPRKILVTLQFFFSIFLIVGTIVFNQQVQFGKNRELGYDQENLVMIENRGEIQKNYKTIKNELLSKGLAVSVTETNSPVTNIFSFTGGLTWEGKRDDQLSSFATIATEWDYTKTMGIKLLEGRDFSEEYNDSLSIILNKACVDYMGFKKPIGEIITWDKRKMKVVGVVENTLMASVYKPVDPMIITFEPTWFGYLTIRVPKTNDLSETLKGIEAIFKAQNPAYPFSYQFADAEFEKKFSRIQMITSVANIFAALAIIISCLGLFGLAAYTAEQRTKEIGIRKVMGASVSSVVLLLSRDFARLVLIAFVIATPLAWWTLDNYLKQYPYRVQIEWWTLVLAGAVTLIIALLTVSSQALKAAVNNPATSLRSE